MMEEVNVLMLSCQVGSLVSALLRRTGHSTLGTNHRELRRHGAEHR